jgi:hypothetical protein
MKKYSLSLFFFQLLASALVMIAEANTGSLDPVKSKSNPTEERDLEMETNQETDVLPDLISLAMHHLYQ